MNSKNKGTRHYQRKGSKTSRICKYLLNGNVMNNVKAFEGFETTRLSSHIKALRDKGYVIETFYKPNSKLGHYRMNSNQDKINLKVWKSNGGV